MTGEVTGDSAHAGAEITAKPLSGTGETKLAAKAHLGLVAGFGLGFNISW